MAHFLWRLDGTTTSPKAAAWQEGLTLHLLFQSLTTIIARRDGQTRHYLSLEGCPSCRADGCDRLCHRMLFAQLVRTTLPGVTLTPIARLAPRTRETRHALAVPRSQTARLLDGALLAHWSEGRVITTWSKLRATTTPIMVGARLHVGADGPDLTKALSGAGWRAIPLLRLVSRRACQAELPPPVQLVGRGGEALLAALRDPQYLAPLPVPSDEV